MKGCVPKVSFRWGFKHKVPFTWIINEPRFIVPHRTGTVLTVERIYELKLLAEAYRQGLDDQKRERMVLLCGHGKPPVRTPPPKISREKSVAAVHGMVSTTYKTHGCFGGVVSFLTHQRPLSPSHTSPSPTLNRIPMAYQQSYTQSTGSTVNGGELDASLHPAETQPTMTDVVLGDDLYDYLANWNTVDSFGHGECRERAFRGSVV